MFLYQRLGLSVVLLGFLLLGCNADVTSCQQSTTEPVLDDDTVAIAGVMRPAHLEMLSQAPPQTDVLVLRDSPGGNIYAAEQLVSRFETVRVSGQSCASACVMMLTRHENVCVERSVQFIRFHTISTTRSFFEGRYCLKWVNTGLTHDYIDSLPAGLRARVAALPSADMLITISLDEFLEYYPDKLCAD